MADVAAFLRAIAENPDDDLPRLVFADWLDEHGEPERAEFIRVQCDLARRPPCRYARPSSARGILLCSPPYCRACRPAAPLRRRERALIAAHLTDPAWYRLPVAADVLTRWTPAIGRGFVEGVTRIKKY